MADQNQFTAGPSIAKDSVDLSAEIATRIERRSDERVTCRRIWGNRYRCNWWAAQNARVLDNPMMQGLLVTTHRVRRSRFLSVTKSGENLVIEDGPSAGGDEG